MMGAVLHILTTGKTAIIPKVRQLQLTRRLCTDVQRLLTHRIPLFFLISTLCQSLMFIPATYLLPQFFQGVRGYAAREAGQMMVPYSITIACTSFIGQWYSPPTDCTSRPS